jgi:sorting nexin-29
VTRTPHTKYQRAEPCIESLKLKEVKTAILSLKNWKIPGPDGIAAELIKFGGEKLQNIIFQVCQEIWNEKKMPENWNKAIIIPLYKKGNRTDCHNYKGIVLLNTVYKVYSKILLARFTPYSEECLGDYQCGFRKGKSTIEQLPTIGQIIEKKYEYHQNMWQVFIDFKKAYDSIHRDSLYNIMNDFGFPEKLIRLTKMCMEEAKYRVRVDNELSSPFTVDTGLKQGDSLSPLLFNLALEKMIRELQANEGGI